MLDLLFHLLIEMLDFFIISSNFPAEAAEGESDEVYTQFPLSHSVSPGACAPGPHQEPGGGVGGDYVGPVPKAVGSVPQD